MDKYLELIKKLEEGKADAEKFFTQGNKSAGTRVRAVLLEVKNESQEIRKLVSEIKNS